MGARGSFYCGPCSVAAEPVPATSSALVPVGTPGTQSGPDVGTAADDVAGTGSPATEHGPHA